ncbi:MAG: acyloxyacyl hydrolase [Salinivirgaceae bacterium]|nr:acyloxyacyl hydrolase [Salinivirgaceae bacterium]
MLNSSFLFGQLKAFQNFNPKIEYSVYGGKILAHREDMNHIVSEPYYGQELRIGHQTTGDNYWEGIYNYPTYGFGLYSGYFNNSIIGSPFAIFPYIDVPFFRKESFSVNWSLGCGVVFNLNEYDSISNPENFAIGTDVNAYIDMSFSLRYKISSQFELGAGVKAQHFSNGAMRHPNLGLNIVNGQITASYLLGDKQLFTKNEIKPVYKDYEFVGMYAFGIRGKSAEEPDTKYLNHTLSLAFNKRVTQKRTLEVGADIFYNEYIIEDFDQEENVTNQQLMSYSVFAGSSLIINKFRWVVQLGYYVHRWVEYSKPVYERVALRYYITPNIFANASIKAHYAKAQCFEWGIGFTF